jgi:capsular polysaccharide biosynthesis protein
MNSHATPQVNADPQPPDPLSAPPRFPAEILFFVWLLVALVTTLVTFSLPESFSSTTRIAIERDQADISGLVDRGTVCNYDPYYLQTQFECIQSQGVLSKVIEDLDLNREWGKKYAGGDRLKTSETLTLLKNRTDLRPVRNTSLIEIRVFSEKPEEAARIANAIAEAYRDYRGQARTRRISGGLRALEEACQANAEKIRNLQAEVAEQSRSQNPANTNRLAEKVRSLEDLQRFDQMLFIKIASERTDLSLPATGMVQIIDVAYPVLRPVRPNKPLNIVVGIIVGGLGGLFLGTLVYVLQRRAFRRAAGFPRTQLPPRFRTVVHILIALTVGVVAGYFCATPLDYATMLVVPLTLLAGGIASAYIELANPMERPEAAGQRLTKY